MALAVQNNVLGLEVTVYNSVFVKALQGEQDLARVEASAILIEAVLFAKVKEQLTAIEEVNHEV